MLQSLMMAALLWVGPHQGPQGDPWPPSDQARPPVVHAVFFYSPSCPHCHTVIQEHLLPLQSEFGEQLRILAMDVSTTWGQELFRATMTHLGVPQDQWGVPYMLVGDEVMTGSLEIPDRLPGRIREGLAGDGIDLPNVGPILDFLDARATRIAEAADPRAAGPTPTAHMPASDAAGPTGLAMLDARTKAQQAQPCAASEINADTMECLVDELQLCLRYHQTLFPKHPIEKLVFLGGEAKQVKTCQTIARALRVAAQLGDPLARLARVGSSKTASNVDLDQPQPGWAVPMGLCLSEANL